MIERVRRMDYLALGLVALSAVVGLAMWPALPEQMAIHFDASSTPDNYVSKTTGVLLGPAIGAGAILFVRAKNRVDPTPADEGLMRWSILFTGVVIAYVQGLVLLWNVGVKFDVVAAVSPVIVGAGLLVAYQYRKPGRWLGS
jgi:uncharacterized membrane protein